MQSDAKCESDYSVLLSFRIWCHFGAMYMAPTQKISDSTCLNQTSRSPLQCKRARELSQLRCKISLQKRKGNHRILHSKNRQAHSALLCLLTRRRHLPSLLLQTGSTPEPVQTKAGEDGSSYDTESHNDQDVEEAARKKGLDCCSLE
jgi:hypothetical protein